MKVFIQFYFSYESDYHVVLSTLHLNFRICQPVPGDKEEKEYALFRNNFRTGSGQILA